jgi:hypothetical protein
MHSVVWDPRFACPSASFRVILQQHGKSRRINELQAGLTVTYRVGCSRVHGTDGAQCADGHREEVGRHQSLTTPATDALHHAGTWPRRFAADACLMEIQMWDGAV